MHIAIYMHVAFSLWSMHPLIIAIANNKGKNIHYRPAETYSRCMHAGAIAEAHACMHLAMDACMQLRQRPKDRDIVMN